MRPRFQADENLNSKIIAGVLRREPGIDFQTAAAAKLLGQSDIRVLEFCAANRRVLVSHDQRTIPAQFREFIKRSESPGVLIISQHLDLRQAIDELFLIWSSSEDREWINQMVRLPL
ncbi:MAG: DUF5615 family PIN-like protein [Acidobacteria bacterium]|nr:DUF5615 family PIN-like protein [Acidobacteriota bacterium]MBV9147132.1 DUF5615 family PIN-like protein [Acidobacteriota bacterium]MBV9437683.1 DUF5615 family PIN-like protein [Acidobacteriota bacterium]